MSTDSKGFRNRQLNNGTRLQRYQRYGQRERWRGLLWGRIFWLLTLVSTVGYVGWWFITFNHSSWYLFAPFILAELAGLVLFILWGISVWDRRHHDPDGLQGPGNYMVDVFIPVCGEPLDIIEKTLSAAVSLDHRDKVVYLLDDQGDARLEALAEEYGAGYFRRPTHEVARKAGNLNYALERTHGDLVLALDADQVSKPELIQRLIGYFDLEHVGFVQTFQSFLLPPGDPWGNADSEFYKAMQSGRDHDNAAISCGSGVMYRRDALEEIGGFSEWNLVEDVHTSMRLHDRGWRSVYHDTPYTQGTAPNDVVTQVKQRWQWAVDSLRMFFWDNPLIHSGLSWRQKMQYFYFGYFYLNYGLFFPILFTLPIVTMFTHQWMSMQPVWVFAAIRLPISGLRYMSSRFLSNGWRNRKAMRIQIGLFAVYFNAIWIALMSRRTVPKYTTTNKEGVRSSLPRRIRQIQPHLFIVTLAFAAMAYGIVELRGDPWFLGLNLFWCGWTIFSLFRFMALSIFGGTGFPTEPVRFPSFVASTGAGATCGTSSELEKAAPSATTYNEY